MPGGVTSRGRAPIAALPALGLLIAAVALGAGLLLPSPSGVEPRVQAVLAVFGATVVLWITRPVPYAVSSLLCVLSLYGLGLADSFAEAVGGFASTIVFFFILLYLIGSSVASVNLDEWVARRLVSETSTPRSSVRRLSSAILLLSFVMPSGVARTVTFMPVVDRINDLYEMGPGSPFRRFGYYLLGHVNPLTSLVVMTGSGMSVTTAELISSMVRPFTWFEWAIFMAPPVVAVYVLAILAGSRVYAVGDGNRVDRAVAPAGMPAGSGGPPSDAGLETGAVGDDPLNRDQWIVVVTLGLAIVAWVVGSFVGVPAIVPAMGVVLVLALPGVEILTARDVEEVSWGVVFLMGAMLSLLSVMEAVGALDLLIDTLLAVIPTAGPTVFAAVVLFGVAVLIRGTFSSSSVAIVILLPILFEFAPAIGLEPLYVALTLALLFNATVLLPFNIPPVVIAQEAGPLTVREIVLLGLMTLSIVGLVVGLSWTFYWPLVDDLVAGLM